MPDRVTNLLTSSKPGEWRPVERRHFADPAAIEAEIAKLSLPNKRLLQIAAAARTDFSWSKGEDTTQPPPSVPA